jgi:hypothetical protein
MPSRGGFYEFRVKPGRENDFDPCGSCGATTHIAHSFVYCDGTPRAVYLVRWPASEQHPDADVAVSIGGWCDADQSPRKLGALYLRPVESDPVFTVVDAA